MSSKRLFVDVARSEDAYVVKKRARGDCEQRNSNRDNVAIGHVFCLVHFRNRRWHNKVNAIPTDSAARRSGSAPANACGPDDSTRPQSVNHVDERGKL